MRIEELSGMRVILVPAYYIGEPYEAQRRTHHKYRTNKKWKKRYGIAIRYKDRIIVDIESGTVYMTEKEFKKMERKEKKHESSRPG